MSERKRLFLLILVMSSVALIVGAIATAMLYDSAFEESRERLVVTAQSQARLIEAVARFDAVQSKDFPKGAEAATLSQITDAHKHYKGFGRTGEWVLARRESDRIVFLLSHRHSDLENPQPVPFDSELAEPMRRALSGQSGTIVGLDYRGVRVLAAYEPVGELNLGIVAKINLAEIRAPFVRSSVIGFGVAVVVVLLGSAVFVCVANPMLHRIADQESRLQSIIDTVVDSVITIDERGVIESVNQAAEQIFGYPANELIGRNVNMLMPVPYREDHDGYIARYLQTGEAKIIGIGREVQAVRKDGTVFPADLAVSEVHFRNRRLFTGIVRDVTDKRRSEERALQAERLAAIGQMVTGLAHESRNAIQRAQACQEMLALDLEGQPELLDLSQRTQRALDDLHKLYEDVRGYAVPIKLEPESCDLSELWRKTWANLEFTRGGRDVCLHEETNGLDLKCKVDRLRVEQVFRNVLENALDECPDPGEVVIRCAETDQHGAPALQIALCDNGPGFTSEQAQRIFEPFFSTKKEGTGLGMAIARRIVEAHGGHIKIGNSGHPGAEIIVTLPREPM